MVVNHLKHIIRLGLSPQYMYQYNNAFETWSESCGATPIR